MTFHTVTATLSHPAMSLLLLLTLASCTAAEHIQYAIRRGEVPMRGVNLGGWLVIEHWINHNSSMYDGVDADVINNGESQVMQFLTKKFGRAEADRRFEEHHRTFITEEDIKEIADAGVNSIRVPVGWWITGFDMQDPRGLEEWKIFTPNGLHYLDLLIKDWAKKYNLAVLVSFHAVKGGQNILEPSATIAPGMAHWGRAYPENFANTVDFAWFVAGRYKNEEAFLGVDLLNQAFDPVLDADLKYYYDTAYKLIRFYQNNDCILIHEPRRMDQDPSDPEHSDWKDYGKPSDGYFNYWHSWHKYVFYDMVNKTADWIMNEGIPGLRRDIQAWTGNPMMIGEWSFKVPAGVHFDDLESFREYTRQYLDALSYAGAGWTFWTWKVDEDEGIEGWSMRSMIRNGFINLKNDSSVLMKA